MWSLPDRLPQGRGRLASGIWRVLANPELQPAFLSGFNVLFSLVGLFTYITFYLAAPPFLLGPAALGSVFFVYLVGVVVTPLAGRLMGRLGFRKSLMMATGAVALGAVVTLSHQLAWVLVGLTLSSSGAFVSQAAASGYVSQRSPADQRTSALGVYLSCYYLGGSFGAAVPGLLWRLGGWPACVALLVLVQLATALLVRSRFRATVL